MEERILKSHKISIFNRSSGIISGVKEVISFDPNEIILDTEQGMLMIQGEELHVTKTYSGKRRSENRRTCIQHGFFG